MMSPINKDVDLLAKQRPQQARAKRTYETILKSAAELLQEVGAERISTNLIAERAGVTVPALYRYFPNKYAVIHALGVELMQRQNSAFQAWLHDSLEQHTLEELMLHTHEGLVVIYEATRDYPAGIEVFNALRAMAPLRDDRSASRKEASGFMAQQIADIMECEVTPEIQMKTRVTVDAVCGIIEAALEYESADTEHYLKEGAKMIVAFWHS